MPAPHRFTVVVTQKQFRSKGRTTGLVLGMILGLGDPGLGLAAGKTPLVAPRLQCREVQTLLDQNRFSGSVALGLGADKTWTNRQDPHGQKAYFTASLTKWVTTLAILSLESKGRLQLDDRLCQHMADCPQGWTDITLRQLLTHQSGIADYETHLVMGSETYTKALSAPHNVQALIAWAKTQELEFLPGTRRRYSNTGYLLLSQIVHRLGGHDFEYKTLFAPLGLTDVSFGIAPRAPKTKMHLVQGRLQSGKLAPRLDLKGDHGDANLIATAPTVQRLLTAVMANQVLGAATTKRLLPVRLGGEGLGFNDDGPDTDPVLNRNGSLPGYRARLVYLPKDGLSLVLLSANETTDLVDLSQALIPAARTCAARSGQP